MFSFSFPVDFSLIVAYTRDLIRVQKRADYILHCERCGFLLGFTSPDGHLSSLRGAVLRDVQLEPLDLTMGSVDSVENCVQPFDLTIDTSGLNEAVSPAYSVISDAVNIADLSEPLTETSSGLIFLNECLSEEVDGFVSRGKDMATMMELRVDVISDSSFTNTSGEVMEISF